MKNILNSAILFTIVFYCNVLYSNDSGQFYCFGGPDPSNPSVCTMGTITDLTDTDPDKIEVRFSRDATLKFIVDKNTCDSDDQFGRLKAAVYYIYKNKLALKEIHCHNYYGENPLDPDKFYQINGIKW